MPKRRPRWEDGDEWSSKPRWGWYVTEVREIHIEGEFKYVFKNLLSETTYKIVLYIIAENSIAKIKLMPCKICELYNIIFSRVVTTPAKYNYNKPQSENYLLSP